tara:strand:+ start:52 stop:972 length:921 start_codon:yes stop_codon:yes gene_type:complete
MVDIVDVSNYPLIQPAPHISASDEYNQASLLNLLGFSGTKAKEILAPTLKDKTPFSGRERGLMALLEMKLGNLTSARKHSSEALKCLESPMPSWIKHNEAHLLHQVDRDRKKADDLFNEVALNWEQVFWKDEPFGIVKDRTASMEWWTNDEVPVLLPNHYGYFILNAGATKILGESLIEYAIEQKKPEYTKDISYVDEGSSYFLLHVGEAIIPDTCYDLLGGDDVVKQALEAGRARLFSGINLYKNLIKQVLKSYDEDWLNNKLDEINYLKNQLFDFMYCDKVLEEAVYLKDELDEKNGQENQDND